MITQAVILAAGRGQRLGSREVPKPLSLLGGVPLLERSVTALHSHGIRDIGVVIGYRGHEIRDAFASSKQPITWIENPRWQEPNGVSLLAARSFLRGRALLLMADHLFCPDVLLHLVRQQAQGDQTVLVVDPDIGRCFDLDDATKVRRQGDHVVDIGKRLAAYDAIDTGIFLISQVLLDALETLPTPSLSDGVRLMAQRGLVRAQDIQGELWQDVDTP